MMKYYFLALLIWIAKILLWISIIGITIERYLSMITDWFDAPFFKADNEYWIIYKNRKSK